MKFIAVITICATLDGGDKCVSDVVPIFLPRLDICDAVKAEAVSRSLAQIRMAGATPFFIRAKCLPIGKRQDT